MSEYKTEKQWQKLGRIPKDGAEPEWQYSNSYHSELFPYYALEDTREMSSDEIKAYQEKERAQRRYYYQVNKFKNRAKKNIEKNYKSTFIDSEKLLKVMKENPEKVLILDTETTGLDPHKHGIVELSIIDATGAVLYDTLTNPGIDAFWSREAQEVNNITRDMIEEREDELPLLTKPGKAGRFAAQKILDQAEIVVGFNVLFDLRMLAAAGFRLPTYHFDLMKDLVGVVPTEWLPWKEDYKCPSLTESARYYKYEWPVEDQQHRALADTKATHFILQEYMKTIEKLS